MYDNKPLQNLSVINIEGPISLDTVRLDRSVSINAQNRQETFKVSPATWVKKYGLFGP